MGCSLTSPTSLLLSCPTSTPSFTQTRAVSANGSDVVVFRSADHVLFNVHRVNLCANTDGPLALPESAETLELLFLHGLARAELDALAEAAEKYGVSVANKRPLEVMAHAYRHGYTDLLDMTAPYSIGMPASEVKVAFSESAPFMQACYNDTWMQLITQDSREIRARTKHNNPASKKSCTVWKDIAYRVDLRLWNSRTTIVTSLDSIFVSS
ncbi:hypothetical protein BD626DRAFT_488518, partial [Schizophyllum amplum]